MASHRLTKKGYERLRAEFEHLARDERPKTVQGVATAAAEGDRSENAEYIYGKKRLREIDRRLQYLARLLKAPRVINKAMVSADRVNFGCRVTVLDEEGRRKMWTIVGEGEADFKDRTISCEAPVAKALLGQGIGDVVEVDLANNISTLEIIDIAIGEID